LVPEEMWGLKISVACFCHDLMWAIATLNEDEFISLNVVFLSNIATINAHCSSSKILSALRMYRAATYMNAVGLPGWEIFKRDKLKPVSHHIEKYIDDDLVIEINKRAECLRNAI